jgi:hypothetical protein
MKRQAINEKNAVANMKQAIQSISTPGCGEVAGKEDGGLGFFCFSSDEEDSEDVGGVGLKLSLP